MQSIKINTPASKLNWRHRLVGLATVIVAMTTISCNGDSKTAEKRAVERFQTEFDDPNELDQNWHVETGEWKIENGGMIGKADGMERGVIWLNKPLPGAMEIEYDAVPLDEGWDVNCLVAGNGKTWSGYEIMIGGYSGTKAGLAICHLNQRGDAAKDDLEQIELAENLMKGKKYHVRILRTTESFKVWLNDILILTDSGQFEHASDKQFFAFSTWDNRVEYKNLKIRKADSN